MPMIDTGDKDDKIIAVATKDPSVNHITDISELPRHFFNELKNFFEQYKVLENKQVQINDFQSKEEAFVIINDAIKFYTENFSE
jgi:inorganic pyrophosphatase